MNQQEAYAVLQKASGIEVGDTVKVLREARYLEMGWAGVWVDGMIRPGGTGTITGVHANSVNVRAEGINGWIYHYPFFVLEVVKKREKEIIIGGNVVSFSADGGRIEVGCITIYFDKVKKIYERMMRLQG